MAYCRKGIDSDVYVFQSLVFGHLECLGCSLSEDVNFGYFESHSPLEMIEHLLEHRNAGHLVPQRAIERLEHAC